MIKLLALVLITACSVKNAEPTNQQSPSHSRADVLAREIAWIGQIPILRFEPFYAYFALKAEVEGCAGIKKEGMPTFYVAPVSPLAPDGRIAFYAPDSKSVVFALGWEKEAWIVRHELLHWILDGHLPPAAPNETPDQAANRAHPPEFFGLEGRCGALVNLFSAGPAATVPGLGGAVRPPAVTGLIVPVDVDPVQASTRRSRTHVLQEGFEAVAPALAHRDTATAVVLPVDGQRVHGAIFGHRPRAILAAELSVSSTARRVCVPPARVAFSRHAATALGVATSKMHGADKSFGATLTAATPNNSPALPRRIRRSFNHGQTPICLPSQIQRRCSRHERNITRAYEKCARLVQQGA